MGTAVAAGMSLVECFRDDSHSYSKISSFLTQAVRAFLVVSCSARHLTEETEEEMAEMAEGKQFVSNSSYVDLLSHFKGWRWLGR